MQLQTSDILFTRETFQTLFPLEKGALEIAGGKRPGQTAGMCRYTALAGKEGREHVIELGYGTVPDRSRQNTKSHQDLPLLLPKLDSELGRFNIDGNTHNVLILRFTEQERQLRLASIRNFNAPREVPVDPAKSDARYIKAVLDVVPVRIQEIINGKINTDQPPEAVIRLILNALTMRCGHKLGQSA